MNVFDKIYLIGFMGSGKTTTGKELARKLGWNFLDLDEEIEKKTGMPIREIFSIKGEAWFRQTESETLAETGILSRTVVATGGGTPCIGENLNYMQGHGLTVYLKFSPAQLAENLEVNDGKRPLLEGIAKNNLEDYITLTLAEREKWYLSAKLIIDGNNTSIHRLSMLVRKMII